MELAKQPKEQTQLTPVEKLSQGVTAQALVAKDFKKASETLPSRIKDTLDLPKVREMVMATGEDNVCGLIEFELIKLAERINVSGNLTDGQIQFVAKQLVQMFPNETVADFKLCFERGASGAYGRLYKLDGVEIGLWMTGARENGKVKVPGYLDEKYTVMEEEMMKEKDNQWARAKTNTDWLKLWQESIEKTDKEGGVKTVSQNLTILSNVRALTDKQIEEQGKEKPKREPYFRPSEGDIIAHNEKVRKFQEMTYRERHPNATDEEVKDFLEKMKAYDAKTKY